MTSFPSICIVANRFLLTFLSATASVTRRCIFPISWIMKASPRFSTNYLFGNRCWRSVVIPTLDFFSARSWRPSVSNKRRRSVRRWSRSTTVLRTMLKRMRRRSFSIPAVGSANRSKRVVKREWSLNSATNGQAWVKESRFARWSPSLFFLAVDCEQYPQGTDLCVSQASPTTSTVATTTSPSVDYCSMCQSRVNVSQLVNDYCRSSLVVRTRPIKVSSTSAKNFLFAVKDHLRYFKRTNETMPTEFPLRRCSCVKLSSPIILFISPTGDLIRFISIQHNVRALKKFRKTIVLRKPRCPQRQQRLTLFWFFSSRINDTCPFHRLEQRTPPRETFRLLVIGAHVARQPTRDQISLRVVFFFKTSPLPSDYGMYKWEKNDNLCSVQYRAILGSNSITVDESAEPMDNQSSNSSTFFIRSPLIFRLSV